MLYKAKVSFSGKVSMAIGDVLDIKDKEVATDLLNAGYIEKATKKGVADEHNKQGKRDNG